MSVEELCEQIREVSALYGEGTRTRAALWNMADLTTALMAERELQNKEAKRQADWNALDEAIARVDEIIGRIGK